MFRAESMKNSLFILILGLSLHFGTSIVSSLSQDGPMYDYTAYTECKSTPEEPLYDSGMLKNQGPNELTIPVNSSAFVLKNLNGNTKYSFSSWIKITGVDSVVLNATITTDNATSNCMGNVIAKTGCWSFLKGGFVLDSPSTSGLIYFQNSNDKKINVTIASASLQPFTDQQWEINQQIAVNNMRKRAAIIHVSDSNGIRLQGAEVVVEQISRDFPFGTAISYTILDNPARQKWFVERFNAAVFENELKWYSTEINKGEVNYTISDQLLEFARKNQIIVRGHNIFWAQPKFNLPWVQNLTGPELKLAVDSRIQSLMSRYKNEFIHWDVDNEMLQWDFFEQKLGPNASLDFFLAVQNSDPTTRVFMNEYDVCEKCADASTVDKYISSLRKFVERGVNMVGIGLEGHFRIPNPVMLRAVIDKLATLNLPIWLTEVDINKIFDQQTQAKYLEVVLREGFSHPAINGIMLWSARGPRGCYQTCLTDPDSNNLPAGDTVDSLLKEWQTGVLKGPTDERGAFSFSGFLGEYKITVNYENRTANATFSLCKDNETKHWNIQL